MTTTGLVPRMGVQTAVVEATQAPDLPVPAEYRALSLDGMVRSVRPRFMCSGPALSGSPFSALTVQAWLDSRAGRGLTAEGCAKAAYYRPPEVPVTSIDQVIHAHRRFRGGGAVEVHGSLYDGVFVRTVGGDPFDFSVLRGRWAIPQGQPRVDASGQVAGVTFGGLQDIRQVQSTVLSEGEAARREVAALYSAMHDPSYFFGPRSRATQLGGSVGYELECWSHRWDGRTTGVPQREAPLGLLEFYDGPQRQGDYGIYSNPLEAALGMSRGRLDLEKQFPLWLLTNSSVPLGDVATAYGQNMNPTRNGAAHYMAAVSFQLMDDQGRSLFGPKTFESTQVRLQQAWAAGHPHDVAMMDAIGPFDLWTMAASHANIKMPQLGSLWVNLSNLMASELGAVAAMLHASSSTITNAFVSVGRRGPLSRTRDVRHFIANDSGKGAPVNRPIRDVGHAREISRATMTQGRGGADRIERSFSAYTDLVDDEEVHTNINYNAHRWRAETGAVFDPRLEMTNRGATSTVPKALSMAHDQFLFALAVEATIKGRDALEYAAEMLGVSVEKVMGSQHETTREYFTDGPSSPRAQRVLEWWELLAQRFRLPAVQRHVRYVGAARRRLLREGDWDDFFNGYGTLGAANLADALSGRSGEEQVRRMHFAHSQEAQYAVNLDARDRELYVLGEIGFRPRF